MEDSFPEQEMEESFREQFFREQFFRGVILPPAQLATDCEEAYYAFFNARLDLDLPRL